MVEDLSLGFRPLNPSPRIKQNKTVLLDCRDSIGNYYLSLDCGKRAVVCLQGAWTEQLFLTIGWRMLSKMAVTAEVRDSCWQLTWISAIDWELLFYTHFGRWILRSFLLIDFSCILWMEVVCACIDMYMEVRGQLWGAGSPSTVWILGWNPGVKLGIQHFSPLLLYFICEMGRWRHRLLLPLSGPLSLRFAFYGFCYLWSTIAQNIKWKIPETKVHKF